jgi:hypothetical protein
MCLRIILSSDFWGIVFTGSKVQLDSEGKLKKSLFRKVL